MSARSERREHTADAIRLVDRRRGPRRELREPTDVTFFAADAQGEWRCCGVMLNACTFGIACRVSDTDSAGLAVGGVLRVVFRIGDTADPFESRARIVNITEGGTPGYRVVGLEFISDGGPNAESRRFVQALASVREPNMR